MYSSMYCVKVMVPIGLTCSSANIFKAHCDAQSSKVTVYIAAWMEEYASNLKLCGHPSPSASQSVTVTVTVTRIRC
jgi:hypothetical protein